MSRPDLGQTLAPLNGPGASKVDDKLVNRLWRHLVSVVQKDLPETGGGHRNIFPGPDHYDDFFGQQPGFSDVNPNLIPSALAS